MQVSAQRGFVERKGKEEEPKGYYVRVTDVRPLMQGVDLNVVTFDLFGPDGKRRGWGMADEPSFRKRFKAMPGDCPKLRDRFAADMAARA